MGGILTLILAENHQFDGIFTISAPAGVQSFLFKFVPIFKIFVKYHPINSEKFKRETDGKWVGYDKIPVNMGIKIKNLLKEMKKSLHHVNCPSLLFQGCLDSDIKDVDVKDNTVRVTLERYKYATKSNAKKIGKDIGKAYQEQVYGKADVRVYIMTSDGKNFYTIVHVSKLIRKIC